MWHPGLSLVAVATAVEVIDSIQWPEKVLSDLVVSIFPL